jgi:hypothetical protein
MNIPIKVIPTGSADYARGVCIKEGVTITSEIDGCFLGFIPAEKLPALKRHGYVLSVVEIPANTQPQQPVGSPSPKSIRCQECGESFFVVPPMVMQRCPKCGFENFVSW